MSDAAIVWLSVGGYWVVGITAMIIDLPRAWRNAKTHNTESWDVRDSAQIQAALMLLLWWVMIPLWLISTVIDYRNPDQVATRRARRENRTELRREKLQRSIKELHDELGMAQQDVDDDEHKIIHADVSQLGRDQDRLRRDRVMIRREHQDLLSRIRDAHRR